MPLFNLITLPYTHDDQYERKWLRPMSDED
jgi:hypothetical protein